MSNLGFLGLLPQIGTLPEKANLACLVGRSALLWHHIGGTNYRVNAPTGSRTTAHAGCRYGIALGWNRGVEFIDCQFLKRKTRFPGMVSWFVCLIH